MPPLMRRWWIALFALVAWGCSKKPRTIAIEVTTGLEKDAFSKDPAVSEVTVRAIAAGGQAISVAKSAPGGGFSLGEFEKTELVSFDVTGTDAAGNVRVRGRSVGVVLENFASDVFPVFAQRVGEMARPAGKLARTHVGGVGGVIGERFLMLTGGAATDPKGATYFDMLALGAAFGGTVDRVAKTMVVASNGEAFLLIDDAGATWVDYGAGKVSDAPLPTGLVSFADVAGGRVIVGSKKESYVVGATRSDKESDRVLIVAEDRALSVVKLVSPRKGAAAAWVNAVGLVVAGGSATGKGVETLAPATTAFVPRPFGPDPVIGAAAVATGSGDELALIGGDDGGKPAPSRIVASSCNSSCMPEKLAVDGLGKSLVACQGFSSAPGLALIVCSESASGQTRLHTVRFANHVVKEIALREPRIGATPVATPLGTLALMGGKHVNDGSDALTVELFLPE
jgi:hypothetical protein